MRSAMRRLPIPSLAAALLLGWAVWRAAASVDADSISYWFRVATIAGGAVVSIALPHLLFPYPRFQALLMAPPTKYGLLMRPLRRASGLLFVVLVPPLVLAARAPVGAEIMPVLAVSLAVLVGVWVVAVAGAVRLGGRSQAWQEGHAGDWYRRAGEHMTMPALVPDGAMPMLFLTTGVFLLTVTGVVAGEVAARALAPGWVVPALMMLAAGIAIWRIFPRVDAELFRSQAFFSELYRMYGGLRHDVRPAVSYDAVYWAPHRLRPAVWAMLVQFDRRLPLGRLIAAAHVLIWLMAFSADSGRTLIAPLLLVSILKNAAPWLLAADSVPTIHLALHRPAGWTFIRVFASIRWTLPWTLSLAGLALFTGVVSWMGVLVWTLIDIALAFALAFAITITAEGRRLRVHA